MTKKKKTGSDKAEKAEVIGDVEFVPSPKDFDKARGLVEKRTAKVPCPELNDVFGVAKGQNVTFMITQCDLSTYLRLQGERQGVTQALVAGLLRALQAADEDEVSKLLTKHLFGGEDGKELSPQARFEVDLCSTCVVEPKLKRSNWLWLAEMYPMIVNRVANRVVDLTLQGGIKKN